MSERSPAQASSSNEPVFAFLAFTSGSFEGAIIRDMRLANALHRRGYRVHVYWMMETNKSLVEPGIPQSVLATGLRYYSRKPSGFFDKFGKLGRFVPQQRRRRTLQQSPKLVDRLLSNFVHAICDGDDRFSARIEQACRRDKVTHLLPTFAMTCPFVEPVKKAIPGLDYVVTFQGEEIFANYAARVGRLDEYFGRLRATVDASGFKAVAVSRDYIERLRDEMQLDPAKVVPIYPGIEPPLEHAEPPRFDAITQIFPSIRPDKPLITYIGRQDPEKGIDLLLYAVRMLRDRGHEPQVFIAGGSSFGQRYQDSCKAIAEHLRVPIFWKRRVSDEVRDALYAHSRAIVYPAIHREPFGMVAAEAMSHGTPVVIPNLGGITEVIDVDGRRGGVTFDAWDSRSLADQLERVLTDDALVAELRRNTKWLASQFTVDRMTDRILEHVGVRKPAAG
jgi:glycosyltransferase involved in cell wall biosynthesis